MLIVYPQCKIQQKLVFTGVISSYQSESNRINTLNVVKVNYKTFYEIGIKFLTADTLTYSDSIALYDLAVQCAEKSGAVVYQAREMYRYLVKQPLLEEVSREEINGRKKQNMLTETQYKTLPHFKIFLNPAASEFSVYLEKKDGEIEVTIYDVLSKIVLKEKLTIRDQQTKLKVDLNNGLYLVRIKSEGEVFHSEHLIIER